MIMDLNKIVRVNVYLVGCGFVDFWVYCLLLIFYRLSNKGVN